MNLIIFMRNLTIAKSRPKNISLPLDKGIESYILLLVIMYDLVLHYILSYYHDVLLSIPFSGPHLLPRHFPRCTVLEPAPITGATRRMQAKLWTWRDVLVSENNGKTTRFPGLRVGKLCENSGKTTISRLVRFRMDSADPMLGELLAGKNGETSPLTRIFLWIVHQHL